MRPLVFVALALGAVPVAAAVPGGCPTDTVRIEMPVMLDLQDAFRDGLPAAERARLDAALPRTADGGIAQCTGHGGVNCDVTAYNAAFNATGLMPRFLATLCPKP